jgi:hypothetical protein
VSRAMFVTVGTSLFHSASWEPVEDLMIAVPGYEAWTRGDLLVSPERRKSAKDAERTLAGLKSRLLEQNASIWAARLPAELRSGRPDRGTVMRYSAELATILKLGEHEPQSSGSFGDFLRSYEAVRLVSDPTFYADRGRLSNVAAHHLAAYLAALAPGWAGARPEDVPGLSSADPDEFLPDDDGSGLPLLAKKLRMAADRHQSIDLVVSGGYKIYGIYLAPLLASSRFRIVYLHEESERLLILPGHGEDPGIWDEIHDRQQGVQFLD